MDLNLLLTSRSRRILLAVSACLAVLPGSAGGVPAPQWMQGGHAARISCVACSPDGTMITSSSEDGTVKLWSTNGTLLRTLSTQPYPTTAVAWSPDGTKIAAGTYSGSYVSTFRGIPGQTYLWQATNGWTASEVSLVRVTTNRYGKISALAFSPDSLWLACGVAEGSNVVRSVADGSVVATRAAYNASVGPAVVTGVAFSSGGMMASGCEDNTIRVYDSSWNLLWSSTSAHPTNVTAVAFSPDGSLLASASLDQTVKIRSTDSWTLQNTLIGHTNGVVSVAFSPNGQKIVTGCMDGTIKVWDSNSTCLMTIEAHALPVTATVFSADGSFLISGSDDGTVRLWSAANGSALCSLGGRSSFIGTVAVSPDGTLCASAGGDETIQVYNARDGSVVGTLAGHTNYVSSLAFSPDSARLASGGGPLDPTIKIWQLRDGSLLETIAATTNGVMALAWSPDGSTLASGGDSVEKTITLWSTNGILQTTLSGHTNGVTALGFSPKGDYLASGGRRPENMVRIWRLSDGSVTRSFLSTAANNNVECVTFSPDGNFVAYGRSAVDVLTIGQVSSGLDVTLGSGANPVSSVVFSPDGRTLAATDQNTVQIWTNGLAWNSWALSETVTQEVVRASSLAYSPNGNLLLCGREDGTLTLSPNARGALGQPRLRFTSIKVDTDGAVKVSASVQCWVQYLIQSSSNMATWSYLTRAVSATNTLSLTNLPAPNMPAGYLRAVTPP